MSETATVFLIPEVEGATVVFDGDLLLVGRHEECDLRIDSKAVSKLHCVLVRTSGYVLLRDLGSTNGCRINGQLVKRGALLAEDILSVAGFDYRIRIGGDPPRDSGTRSPLPGTASKSDEPTDMVDSAVIERELRTSEEESHHPTGLDEENYAHVDPPPPDGPLSDAPFLQD